MYIANGLPIKAAVSGVTNQTLTQTVSFQDAQVFPSPSIPVVSNYTNQVLARSQVSVKTSNHQVLGWRSPAPYRRFVGKVDLRSFDYTYKLANATRHKWGLTPVDTSIGAGTNTLYWGTTLSGGIYTPDVSINLINRCVSECLVKLSNATLNLAVDLAEIKKSLVETIKLVRSLCRAYKAAKRGAFVVALRALGSAKGTLSHSLADFWLSYKYAWQPLMQDIYSGVQIVNNGLSKARDVVSATRKLSEDYGLPPWPLLSKSVWKASGKCETGCEVTLYATIDKPWLAMINSLGFVNPANIAWELIPFSFVVDWLLPIGTWLQALGANIGLRFKSGTRTLRSYGSFTVEQSIDPNPLGTLPSARYNSLCILRTVYTSFPFPLPYVKNPFSSSHLTSAVALVRGLR